MSIDSLKRKRIESSNLIRLESTNITEQLSYYNQLRKIPSLASNVPDCVLVEDGDLLIKIKQDGPQTLISSITKVIALLNKFKAVPSKSLKGQKPPNPIALYEKALESIVKENEKVALPHKSWIINGETYDDLFNTSLYYRAADIIYGIMNNYSPCIVHGNLYLNNVVRSKNNLIIINPRATFGNGPSILGDPRCDLTKLRVSIRGSLDLINKGSYIVYECKDNIIKYDLLGNHDREIPLKLLDKYAESCGIDPSELDLFEGSIYLLAMSHFNDPLKKRLAYMESLKLLEPSLGKFSSIF